MKNFNSTYNFMTETSDCFKQSFAFACTDASAQFSCAANLNTSDLRTAFAVCLFVLSLAVIISVINVISIINVVSVIIILTCTHLLGNQCLQP